MPPSPAPGSIHYTTCYKARDKDGKSKIAPGALVFSVPAQRNGRFVEESAGNGKKALRFVPVCEGCYTSFRGAKTHELCPVCRPPQHERADLQRAMFTEALMCMAELEIGAPAVLRNRHYMNDVERLFEFPTNNTATEAGTLFRHCETTTITKTQYPDTSYKTYTTDPLPSDVETLCQQLATEGRLLHQAGRWTLANMLKYTPEATQPMGGFVEGYMAAIGAAPVATEAILHPDSAVALAPPQFPAGFHFVDISGNMDAAAIGIAVSSDPEHTTLVVAIPDALYAHAEAAGLVRMQYRDSVFTKLDRTKYIEAVLDTRHKILERCHAEPVSVRLAKKATDKRVRIDGVSVCGQKPMEPDKAAHSQLATDIFCLFMGDPDDYASNRRKVEATHRVSLNDSELQEGWCDRTKRQHVANAIANRLRPFREKPIVKDPQTVLISQLQERVASGRAHPLWPLARSRRFGGQVHPIPTNAQLKLLLDGIGETSTHAIPVDIEREALMMAQTVEAYQYPEGAATLARTYATTLLLPRIVPSARHALLEYWKGYNTSSSVSLSERTECIDTTALNGFLSHVGSTNVVCAVGLYIAAQALQPETPLTVETVDAQRLLETVADHTLIKTSSQDVRRTSFTASINESIDYLKTAHHLHQPRRSTSAHATLLSLSEAGIPEQVTASQVVRLPRTYKKPFTAAAAASASTDAVAPSDESATKKKHRRINRAVTPQELIEHRVRDVCKLCTNANISGANWVVSP